MTVTTVILRVDTMPSQAIPHSELWRLDGLAVLKTQHTVYATEHNEQALSVARLTFPYETRSVLDRSHIIRPYFTGCQSYDAFAATMEEDVLSALGSLCNFLGVTLEECILTSFSLGGGVEPMQLIISQSLTAVRGLMAQANRSNRVSVEEENETQVGVPDGNQSVTGMYTIFTNKLCAMSQQLGELTATHLRCVTDVAAIHSLIGSNQSTLTETMGNRFALKQSLTDAKADLMEQINRVNDQSGEHATVQFVNLRLAGHDKLQSELVTQVKEVAYLKEWKLSATARIEKLEELAIQNAAFVVETKVLIAQQAAALEDSKQQLIKMEFHITKLKERISTSDHQGSVVEAPVPAPTISQSANLAAQVSHATFTPTSKKL